MPSKIILYDEPLVPEIDICGLAAFAERTLHVAAEVRGPLLADLPHHTLRDMASLKVINPRRPFQRYSPGMEEVEQERSGTENITMYDGFELQRLVSGLVPQDEIALDMLSVVFTTRLTCTYDFGDYRYHGRALIGANPAIISTTGIIEAPAKPREYYLDLMQSMRHGLNIEALKKKYAGTYLERHDDRLPRIVQGYLLQAAFYHITGEPFCDDAACRLFNAHWQADLIRSQIQSGRLCPRHQGILHECLN